MAELARRRTVRRMRPNYDNTREEPVVLPAQFPNLLVNGTSGIAVGMATNIPPHNLGEVVRACVHLIDNPEATTAQLLDTVKGPDFPLGGKVVTDRATLRKIYEEGTGSIKVQGEWKLEERGKTRADRHHVDPLRRGQGQPRSGHRRDHRQRASCRSCSNLTNESNEKEGLRIALEMKPGTDPNLVMAYLYKHTALQENFAYNLTCLVPGDRTAQLRPERLGLKAMLRHFLDFRFATVRRRFEFELEQLRERIHILEGFHIIFDALDKAIKLIRESDGKADAAEKLIKAFKLDEDPGRRDPRRPALQDRPAGDQEDPRRAEGEDRPRPRRSRRILRSDKKLWGVVKDELTEVGEKYGEPAADARWRSAEDTPEFDPEAYIVRENTNVVLTRDGWIKRVGRLASVEGTRVREGDEVIAVVPGSTLDHVIFFADDGTAYTMRINEVPASSGYGEPIAKFFRLADQVQSDRRRHDRRALHAAGAGAGQRRAAAALPAGGDGPGTDAADAAGAVPHRLDQGGPPLRPAQRGRQGGDGDGARGDEETHLPGVARTATSSTSPSTRSTSCPASARA